MIYIAINCDRCFETGGGSEGKDRQPAHAIRKRLAKEGWKCFPPYDLCPECVEREKLEDAKKET